MKSKKRRELPQDRDRHLDIPSEANRDRHINWREMEDSGRTKVHKDKELKERQRRWREGLEEGKRIRDEGEE